MTVAILNSGIDVEGAEFAGRISPDSRAFEQRYARCETCPAETVQFGLDDVVGHGTQLASVAAAAHNGAGVQGIAPDATIWRSRSATWTSPA